MSKEIVEGDGFAIGSLEAMGGTGPGMRKVRRELGVTAFGANVIVLPPDYEVDPHYHETQEELYLCLEGELTLRFGDGSEHKLHPFDMARVDAGTHRQIANTDGEGCTIFCAGGHDGYVGRDGAQPEDFPGWEKSE